MGAVIRNQGWVASPDTMIIDGIRSNDIGLYVDTPPMPPMAQETVVSSSVSGASEGITVKTGVYSDITLTVKCYVFDGGYNPETIYRVLSNAQQVSFGNNLNYYYKVKTTSAISPSYKSSGKNFLNVQFVCSPFRWASENLLQEVTAENPNVLNRGNIYAEPLFVLNNNVQISGICTLTCNDETLTIIGADGNVYIDVAKKKIYRIIEGVPTIYQSNTQGKFWKMVLEPGYNTVTFTGGNAALLVQKNERWV